MPFVRRTMAVLSSLLLLQLTLLGSGTLCAMHHAVSTPERPGQSMREMGGMAAGSASASEHAMSTVADAGSPADPADCGIPTRDDGCRLPWARGQCSSTTCGAPAVLAALVVASADARSPSIEIAAPELVRSGPTFAPELPPPRA